MKIFHIFFFWRESNPNLLPRKTGVVREVKVSRSWIIIMWIRRKIEAFDWLGNRISHGRDSVDIRATNDRIFVSSFHSLYSSNFAIWSCSVRSSGEHTISPLLLLESSLLRI